MTDWKGLWQKYKPILLQVGIALLAGGLASLLGGDTAPLYGRLVSPPLAPPGWVFPVVWTILYTLMGISSYLIITSDASQEEIADAIRLYAYQLLVNFLWPTFFFNFQWYFFALLWLILLWILVFLMIRKFANINKWAAYMNIPYLIWLTFAGYLNAGIWWLNR